MMPDHRDHRDEARRHRKHCRKHIEVRKLSLCCFFVLLFTATGIHEILGQSQIYNLLFNSSYNVTGLDFRTGTPSVYYTNTQSNGSLGEGLAHMEDKNGDLLFYVNSSGVYDKNYDMMPGSNGILANASSAEINVCQVPGNTNKYYIIYNKVNCDPLYYSIVDMTKRSGLGDVTTLNYKFESSDHAEGLEVVVKEEGESYWLLAYKCKTGLVRFLIDSAGIHSSTLIYSYNTSTSQFELDYHKGYLVCAFNDINGGAMVGTFNSSTGNLSNVRFISGIKFFGAELSPDTSKVFFSKWYLNSATNANLYQYRLSDLKLMNSWSIMNHGADTPCNGRAYGIGEIEMGPNGNLYIPHDDGCAITEIVNPESDNPTINTIKVNYILSLGVSDFIQSTVYTTDFRVQNTCYGDITRFALLNSYYLDSVFWNFGDTASGSQNISKHKAPSHLFTKADTFHVNVTAWYDGGDSFNLESKIVIHPYPETDFTINNFRQCFNNNLFEFTNNTKVAYGKCTWSWNFGNGQTAYTENAYCSYGYEDSFMVKLTATSDYGCKNAISKSVFVIPPKAAFTVLGTTSLCAGTPFGFANQTKQFGDSMRFKWYFGDGDSTDKRDTVFHSYRSEGTFIVTLIAFSSVNCCDTFSLKVDVSPPPKPYFVFNDTSQCFKEQDVMLTNQSSISSGSINKWEWVLDGVFVSPSKTYSKIYNLSAKMHELKLICTSNQGCKDSFTSYVTIFPSPVSNYIINDPTQCEKGQHFEFTSTSSVNGDSINNIYWLYGSDTVRPDISGKSVLHNVLKPGSHRVYLYVQTPNNCHDSTFKTVTVYPSPQAAFLINNPVQCENEQSFEFTNSSTVTDDKISDLLWILGADSIRNQQSVIRNDLEPGTWNLELIVTTSNLCTDTIIQQITVLPSPKADFSINDSAQCENQQLFEFTNTSKVTDDTISALLWIFGADSIRNQQSVIRNNIEPATLNLKLIVTNTNLCSDTALKQIFVFPAPSASFSINDSVQCLKGNSFEFTNKSDILSGSMNYFWIFSEERDSVKAVHVQKSYNSWGNFGVKLIAYSDKNCIDSISRKVFVYPDPVASFVFHNYCLDDTMYFYDRSFVDTGEINAWLWDFDNGHQSLYQNPQHIFIDTGLKAVNLRVISNFGCSSDTTLYFYIKPHVSEPILERATVIDNENVLLEWLAPLSGHPVTYHIERSEEGLIWQHLKDENIYTFSLMDTAVDVHDKSYHYRINVTDSCGYTGLYSNKATSIHISVDTTDYFPILTWTPYELWVEGVMSYELQVKGWGDFQTLIEIPNSAFPIPSSAISQTDSFFTITGKDYCYRVIAYRSGDSLKSVSNEVCIPVIVRLYVPNAFSPNGDGLNDIFKPEGVFIKEYSLMIFNRWGELLFETNDIADGWNGTFKGEKCPLGYYYYQIRVRTAEGKNRNVSGGVHLLR